MRRTGPDAQETKFQLGASPGHFKAAGDGPRGGILTDQLEQVLAGSGDYRDECQFLPVARVKPNSASQTEDRINHRTGSTAQSISQGCGGTRRVPPAQKLRAVGLMLNSARRAGQNVASPDGILFGRTRAAMRNQNPFAQTLGLDKHFCESRMGGIRPVRSHRQFQIAGQLHLPRAQ